MIDIVALLFTELGAQCFRLNFDVLAVNHVGLSFLIYRRYFSLVHIVTYFCARIVAGILAFPLCCQIYMCPR